MFYFLQSSRVCRWLQANKVAPDMKLDNILTLSHFVILCNKKHMNTELRRCLKSPVKILILYQIPAGDKKKKKC